MSDIESSLSRRMFGTKSELVLVLAMVGILLVLFTPIPSYMLDFLLITNFSIGLLILLLTFYIDKPISFSTFPSILLIATLFRLSLNVAATRLILSDADAGEVIGAIGQYVVGGNYVIGLVVFLILIVVQYVVVTNGAQRVAEVAARFTLDSMPGKQMSIDADMNMGLIDEAEAQRRRKEVEKEASFYGSMDGASKFVKGDAIAGIIIILIDIIGGLTIGIAQNGMPWSEALHTYTLLTVGDGIVTQIPALVISTATGIIVTRAATDAHFGEEISSQISRYPKSLVMVSIGLLGLMFLPGIPVLPVLTIFIIMSIAAFFALRRNEKAEVEEGEIEVEDEDSQDLYEQIAIHPIEIIVGRNLVDLVGSDDGIFMDKIKTFRKQFAMEMGFVFPSVRLKDDKKVKDQAYEVKVYGAKVASGDLFPDKILAISATEKTNQLEGLAVKDPTYGLPAKWIDEGDSEKAKQLGYTLVDPLTVLVTHFSELVRNQGPELLTRAETEQLIQRVKENQPALYEELIPNVLSLSDVQKVLQNLLREKVSIRNIELILDALVDKGKLTKDTDELTETVRQHLSRLICESLVDGEGQLHVLTFDPSLEQVIQGGLRMSEEKVTLLIDPNITEKLLKQLSGYAEKMMQENLRPILLCSPTLRRHLKRLIDRMLPHLSVLALTEIPPTINIKSYGIVQVDRNQQGKPLTMPGGTQNA